MKVNTNSWPTWSSFVASPSAPDEYNEASVERLMKKIEPHVVRVKGVRPQFDAINRIEKIYFKTDEERKYYDDTERRYLERKAKLAEKLGLDFDSGGGIWALVLLNERCRAAEYCRRYHIADKMEKAVKDGFAAVAAVKYKNTLIAVVRILVEERGVPRDMISLVWGGGTTNLTKKQKTKKAITANVEALKAAGVDVDEMLKTFELEDVEDVVEQSIPAHLRLGAQSPIERQKEIDRFQSGRSHYCLFTFKAGGVGLSLHHSDELTTTYNVNAPGYAQWKQGLDAWNDRQEPKNKVRLGKCRQKDSGYAWEEDIPFIPVRPRKSYIAPTYSAIELVQSLGRCPRLNSLSVTEQVLLFYGNTVEDDVSWIVSAKLKCVAKIVRQRESWQDVIEHRGKAVVEAHIKASEGLVDADDDDINSSAEGEED